MWTVDGRSPCGLTDGHPDGTVRIDGRPEHVVSGLTDGPPAVSLTDAGRTDTSIPAKHQNTTPLY